MYAVFHKSAWVTVKNCEKVLATTCAPHAVLHLHLSDIIIMKKTKKNLLFYA